MTDPAGESNSISRSIVARSMENYRTPTSCWQHKSHFPCAARFQSVPETFPSGLAEAQACHRLQNGASFSGAGAYLENVV
jgi:hypothetical protein